MLSKIQRFFMRRFKSIGRGYSFADDIMATDTIISFVSGGLSLILTIVSIVIGIAKKGNAGDVTGVLLSASFVMSITGLIFGLLSFKVEEGGTNSKRVSVALSIVALILLFVLFFLK